MALLNRVPDSNSDDIARAVQENPRLTANMVYAHKRLDAVEVLDVLAACDGNVVMASHRLKASPQSILASVVGDENGHALLSRYLRAFTMTKTFELVAVCHDKLVESINNDELPPKDVAKTLTSLVQSMSSLTDAGAPSNIDPFTALMRTLPAAERDALKTLVAVNNAPLPTAATQLPTAEQHPAYPISNSTAPADDDPIEQDYAT